MLTSILFDGIAYAMILFVLAVGLTVTMGLLGIINLAHGAFAMVGGYLTVIFTNQLGLPFLVSLAAAIVAIVAISIPIERVFYARIYRRGVLDQVLLTIGLVMMTTALVGYFFGTNPQIAKLPPFLEGTVRVFGREFPSYRLFIVLLGIATFAGLFFCFERTVLGAKIRAAVDNRAMAEAIGIPTERLFRLTFALGCGLAALGGGLAANIVGLTPQFAVQYLVLVLGVVAVGGLGTITGAMAAALIIGIADVAVRYLFPGASSFLIYLPLLLTMLIKPRGLFGRA
jgi:branched-chain amino acid transport system permease protein